MLKINGWNMSSWMFGSDHFPSVSRVICRFQPLIFQGVTSIFSSLKSPTKVGGFDDRNHETANGDDVVEVWIRVLFGLKLYLLFYLKLYLMNKKFNGLTIYVYVYIYNLQVWAPLFQMQGLLKMSAA